MSARYALVASISIGLLGANNEVAHAQDAPGAAQALPPVTVTDARTGVKHGRDETATRRVRATPTVPVYPTTPLAGGDIATDKAPATSNTVDASQIAQTGSLSITDSLVKYVPGIIVNEVAGNPFQPDINFAALSLLRCPARRRDWRCIRMAYASTKRSATPSTGI